MELLDGLDLHSLVPGERPASMLELSERLAAIPLARVWAQQRALEWWRSHAPDVLSRTPSLTDTRVALAS